MGNKYTKEELFKMPDIEVYKLVLEGSVIKRFPNGFWQQSEALNNTEICVRFMIEDVLKWDDEDIKEKLSYKTFIENKLGGMLQYVFNNSPYNAINAAYPDKFKQWELNQVPRDFWTLETGVEAIKWFIEGKLKWTDEDIKEKLSYQLFKKNNLGGMLRIIFNNSPYDAINAVYPNRFKPWELKKVSQNYWTLETGIETTKWLIEEKLKWTDEDIKEKLSHKVFEENNLSGMLQYVFNGSTFYAISSLYLNKFKAWEFKNTQKNYWTLETGTKATKWLIEEKLKWTDEDIKEKLSKKTFIENNLGGMLQAVFNNSPYQTINEIYPNKFKPWEFKKVSKNFWTLETGTEAMKWLIEEELKWTDEDIKENLSVKTFRDNNLSGMLESIFNASPYYAINAVLQNRFKPWELKSVPKNFWTLETGIEATKWLVEEKLKWSDEDIKNKFSTKTFKENNLRSMLKVIFNGSPYNSINAVYPSRFKPWEFKSVPKSFWTLETGIEATKWLIGEKLKWADEDIKEKLSFRVFKRNNLSGMLQYVFNNSPYNAINISYPNKFKKEDLKSYEKYNIDNFKK